MESVTHIGVSMDQFAQRAAVAGAEPPRPQAEEKAPTRRGRGKRAEMRKEGGQEKVQNMKALDDKMEHLVERCNRAKNAAKDFSDTVKAVAEQSGFLTKVVRQLVIAKAGEKFDDRKREVGQLSLLFEREE